MLNARYILRPIDSSLIRRFRLTELRPSTVLDWYLGYLHCMLIAMGMPMWREIRITQELEQGGDGFPDRLGHLQTPDEFRTKFTELCTRGWPWINLSVVGQLDGVLILSIQTPDDPPAELEWTSVNISGPTSAVRDNNFALDRHVDTDTVVN